jgi:hypothetical protein
MRPPEGDDSCASRETSAPLGGLRAERGGSGLPGHVAQPAKDSNTAMLRPMPAYLMKDRCFL